MKHAQRTEKYIRLIFNSYISDGDFFLEIFKANAHYTTLNTVYHGGQFYWWRKPEYLEKTTDLQQVTDKLSHNVVLSAPCQERDSNSQL